jgi:hypothetical protein
LVLTHKEKAMNWKAILGRLREPSTMAGLGILAALVGVPAGLSDQVVTVVAAVAGLAAVALPEGK